MIQKIYLQIGFLLLNGDQYVFVIDIKCFKYFFIFKAMK